MGRDGTDSEDNRGEPSADSSAGGPQAAHRGHPGRNLVAAIGIGVVCGVLLLLILYFARPVFTVIIVAVGCLGSWELARAFGRQGVTVPLPPLLATVAAAVVAGYFAGFTGIALSVAFGLLVVLTWRLRGGVGGYVRDATASVFIAAYLPLLLGFIALLLAPSDGAPRILVYLAGVFASDTGGLLAGATLGRHRMAPVISPKKSWEGFAGSIVLAAIVCGALVWWLLDGAWWYGVVVGVAAAGVGTVGDLVESVMKRDIGIKDMSSLIPGHGGMMDRLDSLLAAAPAVWVLLTVLVPPPGG